MSCGFWRFDGIDAKDMEPIKDPQALAVWELPTFETAWDLYLRQRREVK